VVDDDGWIAGLTAANAETRHGHGLVTGGDAGRRSFQILFGLLKLGRYINE